MSTKGFASIKNNFNEKIKAQQELSYQKPIAKKGQYERIPHEKNDGDGVDQADSATVDKYTSLDGSSGMQPSLLADIATSSNCFRNSQDSLFSGVGSCTESQQGGAIGSYSRQISKDSGASVSIVSTETHQSFGSGTESQFPGAILDPSRHSSSDGVSDVSSIASDNSWEPAVTCDFDRRSSLDSNFEENPPSQDSQESSTDSTISCRYYREDFNIEENGTEESTKWFRYILLCARFTRKPRIACLLKLIMLTLSISAICMGWKYRFNCPAKPGLPELYALMGLTGVLLSILSFSLDLHPTLCPRFDRFWLEFGVSTSFAFLVMNFGCVFVLTIYEWSPQDVPKTDCNTVFYRYVHSMNFLIFVTNTIYWFLRCVHGIDKQVYEEI